MFEFGIIVAAIATTVIVAVKIYETFNKSHNQHH